MSKKLYVGNLSYNTSEEDLRDLFSQFGTVESANIIMDRETHRSKGFGFVELAEDSACDDAIANLDGKKFNERNLRVNEAISKPRNRNNNFRR